MTTNKDMLRIQLELSIEKSIFQKEDVLDILIDLYSELYHTPYAGHNACVGIARNNAIQEFVQGLNEYQKKHTTEWNYEVIYVKN